MRELWYVQASSIVVIRELWYIQASSFTVIRELYYMQALTITVIKEHWHRSHDCPLYFSAVVLVATVKSERNCVGLSPFKLKKRDN